MLACHGGLERKLLCSVWLAECSSGPGQSLQHSKALKLGGFGDHAEEALTVFPSHPALQRVTHAAPELLQQVATACMIARGCRLAPASVPAGAPSQMMLSSRLAGHAAACDLWAASLPSTMFPRYVSSRSLWDGPLLCMGQAWPPCVHQAFLCGTVMEVAGRRDLHTYLALACACVPDSWACRVP